MLPRPIFRRELKASAAARQEFRSRFMLAASIASVGLASAWIAIGPEGRDAWEGGLIRPEAARRFWAVAAAATLYVETLVFTTLAAAAVAASIAEEREKNTLPALLLTLLTRLELVTVKLAGRMVPVLRAMLIGLPIILAGAYVADVPAPLLMEVLAAMAGTAIVAGSLGILASSRHETSAAATREAIGWTMLWLVGMPMFARMPVWSGTLPRDLLVELRRVARWLEPSSPISMLMDPSWFLNPGDATAAMSDRLQTMLAMQAAIVAAAVLGSVAGLRLREPHPTEADPHRGYRPPVGDDPIFWREYDLPRRGGAAPMLVLLARRLLIVLRTILLLVGQAILLGLAVVVPIALAMAAAWLGYRAFAESWGLDPASAGSFDAREALNIFVRAMTMLLGLIPMMLATSVANQITIEHDRKTWESLLMTPMTGPEILASKVRVQSRSVRPAVRCLALLWLLGLACGALHPAGVVLSAAGLVAGTRLGIAIGLRAALRPGATTQSATSAAGYWIIAMMFVGLATVLAPLCSSRELERFDNPRLPWLFAGVLAATAGAMLLVADTLTRRCFDRFDEWVGRPYRAPGPND